MGPSRPAEKHGQSHLFSDPVWSAYICVTLVLLSFFMKLSGATRGKALPDVPIVGHQWWFEPMFITQCRFAMSGWSIVNEGYTKVRRLVIR